MDRKEVVAEMVMSPGWKAFNTGTHRQAPASIIIAAMITHSKATKDTGGGCPLDGRSHEYRLLAATVGPLARTKTHGTFGAGWGIVEEWKGSRRGVPACGRCRRRRRVERPRAMCPGPVRPTTPEPLPGFRFRARAHPCVC